MLDLEANPEMVKKLFDATSQSSALMNDVEIVSLKSQRNRTLTDSWVDACVLSMKAAVLGDIYAYSMARVVHTHLRLDSNLPKPVKHSLGKYLRDCFHDTKRSFTNRMRNEDQTLEVKQMSVGAVTRRIERMVEACVQKIEAAVRDNIKHLFLNLIGAFIVVLF